MTGGKTNNNQLRKIRRKIDLPPKVIAHLLDHATTDQISRFETGARVPTLENAMMLEIILHTPIRVLFDEMHSQLKKEIERRAENVHNVTKVASNLSLDDYCVYNELLPDSEVSADVRERIHRHCADLITRMNLMPAMKPGEAANE